MKHFIHTLLLLCLLNLVSMACNSPRNAAAQQTERSFIMGSGGGFTGAYETYRMYTTGKIEQQNTDFESYSLLKIIPIDSAIEAFNALDALAIEDYSFDRPGNMTYLIELDSNRIKWGAADYPIRKDIDVFFKRIRKMIKSDYE